MDSATSTSGQLCASKCYNVSFDKEFAILNMNYGENRFNSYSCKALKHCLEVVLGNPDTKALIVTGNGKFFSNGLDLKWMSESTLEDVNECVENYRDVLLQILLFPMPTVAAINGHAFAGGAVLALAFDYRVMRKDRGWLCLPEIDLKLQFSPFMIQLAKLRLKSNKVARDAILFGKRFTGPQCLEAEIVDEVDEVNNLILTSKSIAKKCIGGRKLDRDMVRTMKEDLYNIDQNTLVSPSNYKEKIDKLRKKHSQL
ncbi:uncharacterized protein [Antedon mediterranea]|uniref:uncharacterized protein n=1 Tax=Antedon mediterranea TaxID=105859 RepID=UPI003AF60C26